MDSTNEKKSNSFSLSTPKSPLLLIICNLPALFYFLARPHGSKERGTTTPDLIDINRFANQWLLNWTEWSAIWSVSDRTGAQRD